MAKSTINPNELGDLVPKSVHEDHWPSLDMGPKYQEQLKEIAHKTKAVRDRWKCGLLPTWHSPETEISEDLSAFSTPAFFCAVHLSGGNVGVLRVNGRTGDCALFLRLKRADWFAWADKHKVPRIAGRAFTKRMDRELGKKMLMDTRAFKLGPSNVHHPSVLALLCTMSRHDWLSVTDEPTELLGLTSISLMGTFTLVALPPLPAEFEQCLGLLGHSAAFVKDNAGSDDDEVSLSTRNDAKPLDEAWGTNCPGDKVIGSLAHLFEEGATSIRQLAQPGLFMHGLSDFDCYSPHHACLLERMQSAANAKPLPPLYPGDEASYLDPSDDEEALVAAVPAPAPAAAAPKAKTKSVAPRLHQQQKQPKVRAPPKKKKKNGSDSDELSDSDDTSESGSDTSEEDDATSSSGDSDDDGDSGDSDDEEEEEEEDERPLHENALSSNSDHSPSPMASRKRARAKPTPSVPDVNGDQALLRVLVEMAKPCCEQLKQLDRDHGISDHTATHGQLSGDVELLQTARTPVALLAASLSINATLAECLRNHYTQPDCCVIDYQNAHRLHQMAMQAKRFVEEVERTLAPPSRSGAQQG
jgi:hypothetical protein